MASIQRLKSPLTGDVTYRVQIRAKGRPALSKTFPNRKEAEMWGEETATAIRHGKTFPHLQASRTTFAALADRYADAVLRDARPKARTNAMKQLEWWKERFVGLTLAEITPDRIAAARDALASGKFVRGKPKKNKTTGVVELPKEYPRAAATSNKYLSVLSRMFNLAVREWLVIEHNPVSSISKKKEPRGRIRFLSDDERNRLLDACGKSDWSELKTLVMLALSTGARRSELINLRWADVNLDDKNARATIHESKNGDARVLPVVGKALEALREAKARATDGSEFVFTQPSGLPGPYVHFDQHWQKALTTAAIENFRFHDLRHTTASYLAAQGASLLEIADVLGHRTMGMVKRYAHLAQSHKVSAIEKMAKDRGL